MCSDTHLIHFFTIEKNISASYKKDIDTLQQIPPDEKDFEKALETVQLKVRDADLNGVQIFEKQLSEEEFKTKILSGFAAIVLVNSLLFACLECHSNRFHWHGEQYHLSDFPTHVEESVGAPYRGHYILICGYNEKLDSYIYKNPDSDQSICYLPVKTFEKSRISYGTQQNVVFLSLKSENLTIKSF